MQIERTVKQPKLLQSGYWHISLGAQCFAQWPQGEELKREHIFNPDWNERRVMEWYRDWMEECGELCLLR